MYHKLRELKEKEKGMDASSEVKGVVKENEGKCTSKGKDKVSLLASFKEVKDELEERHPMVLLCIGTILR